MAQGEVGTSSGEDESITSLNSVITTRLPTGNLQDDVESISMRGQIKYIVLE